MLPESIALCKKCRGTLTKQVGPTATCIKCGYQNRGFKHYSVAKVLSKKSMFYAYWAADILGFNFDLVIQSFSNEGVILKSRGKKAGGGSPRFWWLPKYVGRKKVQECCPGLVMMHRQQLPIPWNQFFQLVYKYRKPIRKFDCKIT